MAIKPEVADSKILFSNASVCHLLKNRTEMSVIPISDAVVDQYGNMTFADRMFSEEEEFFYKEKSRGLSFVN